MNVKQVQLLLQKLGYDPGDIDGIDGEKTQAALQLALDELSELSQNNAVDNSAQIESNEDFIWAYLHDCGLSDCGVAGLMGNLLAESGLRPNNLQDSYNVSLGMTDDEYVAAVDSGRYANFIRDGAGFGLAQWTYWTRKQDLLLYANSVGKSIGDIEMQIAFLVKEMQQCSISSLTFQSVWNVLKTTTSVKEASDSVLLNYERPADTSDSVKALRASYGEQILARHSGSVSAESNDYNTDSYLKADGYYHIPRGVNVPLSKNLTSAEVMCRGCGCCAESIISKRMVDTFQRIRDRYGKPITIGDSDGSGYRCYTHNAEVGGAANSLHLSGSAFDLHASDKTALKMAVEAEIADGEIGDYSWGIHAGVWSRGYVNRFNG